MKKLLLLCLSIAPILVHGQIFTENNNGDNAVVAAGGAVSNSYSGCAFIDYNNDGWLDLYWVRSGLFLNTGTGSFIKIDNSHLKTDAGYGCTWGDYDNDGFIDCFISGANTRGSSLHKNNGDGTFTKVTDGLMGDSLALKGWGSSWGDINNDTWLDLIIAAPLGFGGITDSNKLLTYDGFSFTRIDTAIICRGAAPYTVPTWSDYDQDGDIDCFIGSGPANGTVHTDYLYNNTLIDTWETGYFTKITTAPIATDGVDGQVWNWIDYDNDGDLDAYLTNYIGTSAGIGMKNNLYRNNGATFSKMSEGAVGAIVGDQGLSLASVWEDFDNEGDLDCFVTNDGSNCKYYQNNNDGTFTSITDEAPVTHNGSYYGATAGDYDKDGDIDLFVSGVGTGKALYNNNSSTNGNHWVNFELHGNGPGLLIGSNRSGLGAQVHIKAKINGVDVWQMREVSAQNSFNSMNSLNVEFGLGDATIIDSLIIHWPSGVLDICVNIATNTFYDVQETFCPEQVNIEDGNNTFDLHVFPNPSNDVFNLQYQITHPLEVEIYIIDNTGKRIDTVFKGNANTGNNTTLWNSQNAAAGIYYCVIKTSEGESDIKLQVIK